MSRRKAREAALQSLFQLDFKKTAPKEALAAAFGENERVCGEAKAYAEKLVTGTCEHMAEIDELIRTNTREWKVERMAGVDRNLVRMAIYESKFSGENVTLNIAINEAVELAKKFGTDASGKFVNGVLGSILNQ